ncbi:GGDEF domain-containing protein [Chitinibacter bivalviorum]|uniref:diguanylate cyclase n=1 Tax=Chitinibacter bivalviorum TaxID=2739434 RepID=A0A7H9BK62_9NEIS|nr:GGDEF domain-containing protein [Chitinibacter bivalviorum]QLG88648.1 GGDEF domain-containing protein [Chitinibacter bivalviorum]
MPLNSKTPQDLVHSLAEFTGLIDRDDLAVSLCLTFFEMLPVVSLRFYRTLATGKQHRLGLLVEFDENGIRQHSAEGLNAQQNGTAPEIDPLLHGALVSESSLQVAANGNRVILGLHRQNEVYALLDLNLGKGLVPSDFRMLQGMARIYENHIALLDYGETDTLTGLLNRKTLERQFFKIVTALQNLPGVQPLQAGRRQENGMAYYFLVVLDIDHFKRINDKLGHLYGDEVLLIMAQLMRSCFRANDRLFRFGGEEFVIILGPQTREGAILALERFRKKVEQHQFPQIGQVTISGGITDIRPYEVLSITLGRADQALYAAKEGGRNKMVFFDTLPQTQVECGSDELF